jgi:hypothetical protein
VTHSENQVPRKRRVRKLKQKKRTARKAIVEPPAKKRRQAYSRAALNRKHLF